MITIPEIGDIITLDGFFFRGINGGTESSSYESHKPARFVVTKQWHDYECGYRGWAVPHPDDVELLEYCKANVAAGRPNENELNALEWDKVNDYYVVFWSKHQVVSIESEPFTGSLINQS